MSDRNRSSDSGRPQSCVTDSNAQLELLSTQQLMHILELRYPEHREAIARVAGSGRGGYLARDHATGEYRLVDTDEVRALLDGGLAAAELASGPQDTASEAGEDDDSDAATLVSTQALRKMLEDADPTSKNRAAAGPGIPNEDSGGGDEA